MTLTAITESGKRHVFEISSRYLVDEMIKLIVEPVTGYTLRNGDKIDDVAVGL
jgi:hypothetical protein